MAKRTVKVEITREDGSVLRVVGDEADKWQKAVEGQATLCMVHGVDFPQLQWEEEGPSLATCFACRPLRSGTAIYTPVAAPTCSVCGKPCEGGHWIDRAPMGRGERER
jgi:hypothetical protein